MKLPGAFVTRFLQEWHHANEVTDIEASPREVVNRFMEAMKYELTSILVPEVIPHATISLPITCDSTPPYGGPVERV